MKCGQCATLLVMAALLVGGGWAAPMGAQRQPGGKDLDLTQIPVANLAFRLGELDPAKPEGYLLLAELVASEAGTHVEARLLARQLYTLAHELDRRSGSRAGLRTSCCLGLAALEPRSDRHRWLLALARVQAPPGSSVPVAAGRRGVLADAPDELVLDVCSVLSFARAGEGRRAEAVLQKPGVSELLNACDTALSENGSSVQKIQRAIADWPLCPDCKNRRFVMRSEGTQRLRERVCPTCGGVPGPRWSDMDLVAQLRLESALLRGTQRAWSAQILADGGAPLRDPEPDELAAEMQVDPRKSVWRDGRWSEP